MSDDEEDFGLGGVFPVCYTPYSHLPLPTKKLITATNIYSDILGRRAPTDSSSRYQILHQTKWTGAFCTAGNDPSTMGMSCTPITFFTAPKLTYGGAVDSQGHVLYPTSICLSDYLAEHASSLVKNKSILELGAGGGLPSLVSALEDAEKVEAVHITTWTLEFNAYLSFHPNYPSRVLCKLAKCVDCSHRLPG